MFVSFLVQSGLGKGVIASSTVTNVRNLPDERNGGSA